MRTVYGSTFLVVVATTVGVYSAACSSGESTGSGSNDLSGYPTATATGTGTATAPAGTTTATATATATAPSAAPTVLLSCQDKTDATSKALLTVDSAFKFSWQIGEDTLAGSLLSVDAPTAGGTDYALHGTDGHFISLDPVGMIVFESGLDVECDPATAKADKGALDNLVKLTAASRAKQQPFATCTVPDDSAPQAWTARPALGGPGAIIEGTLGDDNLGLLATSTTAGANDVVAFKGLGGAVVFAAGQHTTTFTTLTVTPSATAGGPSVFSWDAIEDNQPVPFESNSCTVTGLDFTKSLVGTP